MRILFFSTIFPRPQAPNRGIFCFRLCEALRANGHQLKIISPRTWLERKKRSDIRLPNLEDFAVDYPRYFYTPRILRHAYDAFMWSSVHRKLEASIGAFKPDWMVSYWSHPDGTVAVRAARKMRVRSAVIVGGSDVLIVARQNSKRRIRIAQTLNDANVVIARSGHLRDAIIELGVPAGKVHVIHQGIDSVLFSPGDKLAARRTLGLESEPRSLLFVGNLVDVKGIDVLLKACAALNEGHARAWRLNLVGTGPKLQELQQLANQLKLNGAVHFVGPVAQQDLPNWYRAADLTVLASHSEGIPNVLRESLACATPFVATDVGGIREIAHPELSELVRPGNPEAFAAAMEKRLFRSNLPPAAGRSALTWRQSAEMLTDVLHVEEFSPRVALHVDRPVPLSDAAPARLPLTRFARRAYRQLLRAALIWMLPRKWLMVNGINSRKAIYLTFDDGPHPVHTAEVLDALRQSNVRATFFLVGEKAERYPDLVRRIAREGHAIGHHSYFHDEPEKTSAAVLLREVQRTSDVLTDILGFNPSLVRPPKGQLTLSKLLRLRRLGMTIVLWNRDPKDFAMRAAGELRKWFLNNPLSSGDIVLLHDARPLAASAIPEVVAAIREQRLEFQALPGWDRLRSRANLTASQELLTRPGKITLNG